MSKRLDIEKCANCGAQAVPALKTGVGIHRVIRWMCPKPCCAGYTWLAVPKPVADNGGAYATGMAYACGYYD